MLEFLVVVIGLVVSFFLKGWNLLSMNWEFTGVVYPDFLLIFIIYFALRRGEFTGLWIGFFGGLLEDTPIMRVLVPIQDTEPIVGVHAIIYTLAGFILGKLNRIIDKDSTLPIMFVVFTTTFFCRVLVWLLMGFLVEPNKSYAFFGPAIYTAILAPIWFFLLGWIYRQRSEEQAL